MSSPQSKLDAWDLLDLYWRHVSFFWARRRQLSGLKLTVLEAEFSPPTLALEGRPVSPTLRITALILILFVLVGIVWATTGRVDIVARASGKIIPGGRTKTIASVDTASVRAIQVTDGQTVKAGDILIELDATPLEADRDKATGDERVARMTVARSRALLIAVEEGREPHLVLNSDMAAVDLRQEQSQLRGQYAEFAAKLAQANQDIHHDTVALPLASDRENIYASLLSDRDVSTDAWLEKKQARLDIEGHLAEAKSARARLIAQTKREVLDALADASKAAAGARQDAIHADAHARLLTLRAPEDGKVQQLTVHTLGGVVEAAQPLMLIVPLSKNVEVEATIADKDVGFVQEGQSASVKVAAFEYTKFGTVAGVVDFISRDAVEGKDHELEYSIRVLLDRSMIDIDGHQTELSPGMSVNVDIKTGRRRIIDYLLSPLMRHLHESLHER